MLTATCVAGFCILCKNQVQLLVYCQTHNNTPSSQDNPQSEESIILMTQMLTMTKELQLKMEDDVNIPNSINQSIKLDVNIPNSINQSIKLDVNIPNSIASIETGGSTAAANSSTACLAMMHDPPPPRICKLTACHRPSRHKEWGKLVTFKLVYRLWRLWTPRR